MSSASRRSSHFPAPPLPGCSSLLLSVNLSVLPFFLSVVVCPTLKPKQTQLPILHISPDELLSNEDSSIAILKSQSKTQVGPSLGWVGLSVNNQLLARCGATSPLSNQWRPWGASLWEQRWHGRECWLWFPWLCVLPVGIFMKHRRGFTKHSM